METPPSTFQTPAAASDSPDLSPLKSNAQTGIDVETGRHLYSRPGNRGPAAQKIHPAALRGPRVSTRPRK